MAYVEIWQPNTEKAMAPHSSTLAWKIPWMEEPGRLQSMGSLKVGHDWATSLSLFTFMHWRRKWQPTPVFLPGESQGRGSLVGLPSVGWHRVRHDWSDLAAAAAATKETCEILLNGEITQVSSFFLVGYFPSSHYGTFFMLLSKLRSSNLSKLVFNLFHPALDILKRKVSQWYMVPTPLVWSTQEGAEMHCIGGPPYPEYSWKLYDPIVSLS